MGKQPSPGAYVKSLFKILRLLGVPQLAVAQHLHVPPSAVSMWATGTRPIPQHHYDPFRDLLWSQIKHLQDRCLERQAASSSPQPETVGPSSRHAVPEHTRPATEGGRAGAFEGSPWLLSEYTVLERVAALAQEWERELQQEDPDYKLWEQCQVLKQYGEQDFKTFVQLVRGPGRAAFEQAFEIVWTALRSLDELFPYPDATQLSQYLAQSLKALNVMTTVGTRQTEDKTAEMRPNLFRDPWASSQYDFGATQTRAQQPTKGGRLISFTDDE